MDLDRALHLWKSYSVLRRFVRHHGTDKRLSYNNCRRKIQPERRDLMHQPRRALDREKLQQIFIPPRQNLARLTVQPARSPCRPRESIKIRNLMPLWIRNASHLQRDSRKVGSDGTSRQFLRLGPASRTPRQSVHCRHSVDYKSTARARNQLRPVSVAMSRPFPRLCGSSFYTTARCGYAAGWYVELTPRLYHPDKPKVGKSFDIWQCRNKIRIG